MMAVQGNLELILLSLPEESDEYAMASGAAGAAKGASLVGSMLLSCIGQRPLQLVDYSFSELVQECITVVHGLSDPAITVQILPPEQTLLCSMGQPQIKEVVENILTNAVESLSEGSGTIEISFGTKH